MHIDNEYYNKDYRLATWQIFVQPFKLHDILRNKNMKDCSRERI